MRRLGLIVSVMSFLLCLNAMAQNLIQNPGAEELRVNGEIPNWTEVVGSSWTYKSNDPVPCNGDNYFYAGVIASAELMQDVDVSNFAAVIDAGTQFFSFSGYVRSFNQTPADEARIVVEYRDISNSIVLDTFDSDAITSTSSWSVILDRRIASVGTRIIRIRLISTRSFGNQNDGYYDALSLEPGILSPNSTFNIDDEDWKTQGDATDPVYFPTGGNPGGYISATDDPIGVYWFWRASAKFLGNISGSYGYNLMFDIKQSVENPNDTYQGNGDVRLEGNSLSIFYEMPDLPGTDWTSYIIPLQEGSGWINESTGVAATESEILMVLSNLNNLLIRGEYHSGNDTGSLDNIIIREIPSTEIITPNGGENWKIGNQYDITWTPTNVSEVNLDYSTDNGSIWLPIASNITASDESYPWTIPNTPSSICLVKISDSFDPSDSDFSDNTFIIYSSEIPFQGLIAYYPFNGNANDQSINNNNGTVYGPLLISDRFDNPNSAFMFDGIDDYIDVGNDNSLKPPLSVTISAWIKKDISNSSNPIFKNNYDYNRYYGVSLNIGRDSIATGHYGDGGSIDPSSRRQVFGTLKIRSNEWHHVAGVYRGPTDMDLYADGVKEIVNYSGSGSGMAYNSGSGNIGRHNNNYYTPPEFFDGVIDDIRFYDRALDEHEIISLYNEIPSSTAIEITVPNGGERWDVGSTYDISWNSPGVSDVKIEYSIDDGSNWIDPPIITSYPASNELYSWTIPDSSSDNCKIRISDVSDAGVFDVSDNPFSIIPNVTTVITHGWLPGTLDQDWKNYRWQFAMADTISTDRQICFIRRGIVYRTSLEYADFAAIPGWKNIDDVVLDYFSTNLNLNPNEDVVFVIDWVQESDHNTRGYSEAIADVIYAALVNIARIYPWLLDELHFIGHSRGSVVNSEIIQRLIFAVTNSQDFLPSGVSIDKNIHMTTLDPHPVGHWVPNPMNDDWVNSSNITLIENGKYKRIGVVGWKNGDYRVKHIDNYFQDNFEAPFKGLSNFPGLDETGLFSNVDLTQIVNGVNAHSLVHSWYYGTIDLIHNKDEFGHGSDIERTSWYIDGQGAIQGFYHSIQREGSLSVLESIDDDLYNVNSDFNYGENFIVFNGDFSINPRKTITKRFPGWDYQGGGGDGIIEVSFGLSGMNDHLVLKNLFTSKKHNYFYVPNNASHLFYRIRVKDRSLNDELKVRVGNIEDIYPLQSEYYYRTFSTNITSLKGTYQTLEYEIDGHGLVTSEVWIDDIGFSIKKYLSFIVASPVNLHAYDSNGNHTGPTSDTTWVEEIPNSRYFAESDTLPHPRQIIMLPEAATGVEYNIQIISDNANGSFDFEIQDATDSLQTISLIYDSVSVQPNTVATCTLATASPSLPLHVDIDGDGQTDTTVTATQYLQDFTIFASASANGTISPTDTVIVNFGDSISFTITPDSGYVIVDVLVDSVSVGAVSIYSFNNVTENHAIFASFQLITTVQSANAVPKKFFISQNYPNPFNPVTTIKYGLPENGKVKISIYDIQGRKIETFINESQKAGYHKVIWNAGDYSSGIYFYVMESNDFRKSMKLLLIR